MSKDFELRAEVAKVDDSLGLVMGWGIICTKNGVPYFDTQNDHVPDESMLEAAADFMKHSRIACEQHERTSGNGIVKAGTVVFAWPLTAEIAKTFGIQTSQTGLMVAMKPDAAMLAKFKSGELTGFSIGGRRLVDEEVD